MEGQTTLKTVFIDQNGNTVHTSYFLYKVPFKVGQQLWFNQKCYLYQSESRIMSGCNTTDKILVKEN